MLYESKFLIGLGVTSAIEVPIVLIFLKFIFREKELKIWKILVVGGLASCLTLPYLWFILSPYVDARHYILIGEVLVFLVEALFYFAILDIKILKALLVSLVANGASYYFGSMIFNRLLTMF